MQEIADNDTIRTTSLLSYMTSREKIIGSFLNRIALERKSPFVELAGYAPASTMRESPRHPTASSRSILSVRKRARTTKPLKQSPDNGNGGIAATRGIVKNHALRARLMTKKRDAHRCPWSPVVDFRRKPAPRVVLGRSCARLRPSRRLA